MGGVAAAEGVAAVLGLAAAGGVAVDEPALPAVGATTPGICAADGCAAAAPALVPAEVVAGARAGEPSPGMVACVLLGCGAVGCDWVDAGDAAGAGVGDACTD